VIVYKTTNLLDEKVYVGQDYHENPSYLGSGKLLTRAVKKYGKENFVKEVIDFAESMRELNEKERYWVKFYNCKDPVGYNLTDGGEGIAGYLHTEETKSKISKKLEGKNHPLFGKHYKCSEETKEKMRQAKLGRKNQDQSRRMKGEKNPMKRLEVRAKFMGDKNSSKKAEVKEKIRKSKLGKKRGPNKRQEKWLVLV
jgi:group I intron endonuclease